MAELSQAELSRAGRRRAPRLVRRVGVLFGTAWRADPGLFTVCILATLGYVLLSLAYPMGFRAIVNGATMHRAGVIGFGVLLTALSLPGSWMLRLAGANLGSKLTDQANLRLGLRIGSLVNAAPFLEHFERPEHLAEIDTLRERRRTLAAAPAQTLGLARSGLLFAGAAVLLALIWPPLLVVPLLAAAPGLADRRAGQIEKRNDDELADSRRLLGELFSLAATAGPARELRTFGVTGALLAEHTRLGDEINRQALRAARRAAVWQAAGWLLYAAGLRRRGRGAGAAGRARPAPHPARSSRRSACSAGRSARCPGRPPPLARSPPPTPPRTGCSGWRTTSRPRRPPAHRPVPGRLRDGIRLQRVSFSYPGQAADAVAGLDLELPAGRTVALVGENGAGKTTLVKLLTGMYRPDQGRITVDGADLAEFGRLAGGPRPAARSRTSSSSR